MEVQLVKCSSRGPNHIFVRWLVFFTSQPRCAGPAAHSFTTVKRSWHLIKNAHGAFYTMQFQCAEKNVCKSWWYPCTFSVLHVPLHISPHRAAPFKSPHSIPHTLSTALSHLHHPPPQILDTFTAISFARFTLLPYTERRAGGGGAILDWRQRHSITGWRAGAAGLTFHIGKLGIGC